MKRAVAMFLLCIMLAGCVAAPQPAPERPDCDKLDNILHRFAKNARYAYTATAIDSHGKVHMWFINKKTRRWVQVHVYSSLSACVEMEGGDWRFAAEH